MSDQPTDTGAVAEVTDVESAALEIESRLNAAENNEEPADDAAAELEDADEVEKDVEDLESEEPEEDDGEEPTYSNINQLAEALDMSPEDFLNNIKMTRKIDGVEEEVSLAEIREGNQRDADYRNKTMRLAEERRGFEQEQSEIRGQLERQLTNLATMANFSESQLNQEYNSVNWQELRNEDPAEFSARQTDFQNRLKLIQNLKQRGSAEYQQLQAEAQNKSELSRSQYIESQNELLLKKVPEWSDQTVRASNERDIGQFLADKYGFGSDDVAVFADHRMLLMARDAMRAKEASSKIDIAKKKVKGLPKILKPSSKQAIKNSRAKSRSDSHDRFKKSGSVDDLAEALLSRL